jgi:hypothetical protein
MMASNNTADNTAYRPFKLAAQHHGHEMDVRAVSYLPALDAVVSASRDKTVRIWTAPDPIIMHGHTHFINALTVLPPSPAHAHGKHTLYSYIQW